MVLAAPREDLHGSLEFVRATDQRIEFSFRREVGQVRRKRGDRVCGNFGGVPDARFDTRRAGRIFAVGPQIVDILYDNRYLEAGWMLQILTVATWFQVLEAANGATLLAVAKPARVAAGNFAKVLGMAVLLPVGFFFFGFGGALIGYALSDLGRYAVSFAAVRELGFRTGRSDLIFTCTTALGGGLGWLAAASASGWISGPFASLVAGSLVAVLVWSPALLLAARDAASRRSIFPGPSADSVVAEHRAD